MERRLCNFLLLVILGVAFFLRLGGIYPSYPPYHSDEGMSYEQGISIIKENTLYAHGYSLSLGYPYLIPYINAFSFKFFFIPLAWSKFLLTNLPKILDGVIHLPLSKTDYNRIFQLEILGNREVYVLTWGRILAAFFGVGIVVLIYFLARQILNRETALISSLLVGINYRQVLNSHFDLPDIYNAFFLVLSMIFSYRIIKHRRKVDYLLAGIFVGLSIATKFNVYAAIAFIASFGISILENKLNIFKEIPKVLIAALAGLFVFVIINPFHFIHFEEAVDVISYESKKYGTGRFAVSSYPFWYLFNFGIGKLTSILVLVGSITLLIKKPKVFIFLFLTVGYFFYFMTYATNGGYYTRNFVTITPVILMFPGFLLSLFLNFTKKYLKIFSISIFGLLIFFVVFENFSKSFVVVREYSKPWNYQVIANWINKNIPKGSKVAAHSSVPLPDYTVERLPYDFGSAFSIPEFIKEKADFAVVSLDWVTNDYYGWMNRFDHKWGKPMKELMSQHSAMATSEILDYSIYSVVKPALTPESNFVVIKVPQFNFSDKKKIFEFNNLTSGWESKPISLEGLSGLHLNGEVKNGFFWISFYKDKEDTKDITKRTGVRVSEREKNIALSEEKIITQIPVDAKWAVIGFSSYKESETAVIKNIVFEDADVKVDLNSYNVHKTVLDEDVLFPNSQGNL